MNEFQKYRDEIPFLNDLKFTDQEIELNLIKIKKINEDIKSCENTKKSCCNLDGQHEVFYRTKNNILKTKFVYCNKFKEYLKQTAFLKNYLTLHRSSKFNEIRFQKQYFLDGYDSYNDEIFKELRYQEKNNKHNSLFMFGKSKSGKTKLISAFCNNLAYLNYKIAFVDIKKLLSNWKDSLRNNELYDDLNNTLKNMKFCDILVIDEFGMDVFYSSFHIELLFSIFEYRKDNNLPIYFVSNCPLESLKSNYLNSNSSLYGSWKKRTEQEKLGIEKFINIINEIVENKKFEIKGIN